MKPPVLRLGRIGVIMGGISRERDISLMSGRNVLDALLRLGYDAVAVDAGRDLPGALRDAGVEAAFIALHGKGGEDGTVQGLLEYMGIPYTGSGVAASALGMDKAAAKRIMRAEGLPTPDFVPVFPEDDLAEACRRIRGRLGLPVVVKPNEEGSSIGVRIVREEEFLVRAVQEVRNEYPLLLAEEFIEGKEITVGVLGTGGAAEALPVLELEPKLPFYNYEAKYTKGMTDFIIPPSIPSALQEEAQDLALRLHRLLGCRDMSRVDFMVSREGKLFILEINTIPGFTNLSDLPAEARAAGYTFDDLVEKILLSAFGRDAGR